MKAPDLHEHVNLRLNAVHRRNLGFAFLEKFFLRLKKLALLQVESKKQRCFSARSHVIYQKDKGVPLALCQLKTETVEHELVLICEYTGRPGFLWRESLEFLKRVQRDVLVY